MKTISGNTQAQPGFYWHMKAFEIVPVSDEGGVLPGGEADRYLRVPVPALLLLAPIMGASFVMFLPFIGFAMLGREIWRRALARRGTAPVAAAVADRAS